MFVFVVVSLIMDKGVIHNVSASESSQSQELRALASSADSDYWEIPEFNSSSVEPDRNVKIDKKEIEGKSFDANFEAEEDQESSEVTAPPPSKSVSVTPSSNGKQISVSTARKQLAHGPAVTWNGCDKSAAIQGGFDNSCGQAMLFPGLAKHMNDHYLKCINVAAGKAGYRPVVKVFVGHMGTYNDRDKRGGSGLSLHAYARAIDMAKVTMTDDTGNKTSFSEHVRDYKGKNKIIYDEFRDCWKQSLGSKCSGQKGSIGIPSSRLGGNNLHNDHIHLEFPFCAG